MKELPETAKLRERALELKKTLSLQEIMAEMGISKDKVCTLLYRSPAQRRKWRSTLKAKRAKKTRARRTLPLLGAPVELDSDLKYTIVIVQGPSPAKALLKAAQELL